MKVEEIKLRKRFREKTRNVDALCESIKKIGLLHPIVVDENNVLIAGLGRIRAFEELGYDEIPATKINLSDIIDKEFGFKNITQRAQVDENVVRRNFTPSEMVAIWLAMESYQGQRSLPNESLGSDRQTRAAKIIGISPQTLTRARAVVDYGNQELIEKMDETGNVSEAYKKMERIKMIEEARKKAAQYKESESIKILQGDFREITKEFSDNYFDYIITDPPYSGGYLSLWSDLSQVASRILKSGGFLITYSGTYHLYEVMTRLSEYLEYYWQVIIKQVSETQISQRNIFTMYKPLLIFAKPPIEVPNNWIVDVIEGAGRVKDSHEWQQPIEETEEILEKFTEINDLILDPMFGSGTTLIACKNKKRRCIGIDDKEENVIITKSRLVGEVL